MFLISTAEHASDTSGRERERAEPPEIDENLAICKMELDIGAAVCNESIARFYFDFRSGLCRPFQYYGCGGNMNHFWTLECCQQFCSRCNYLA